MILKVCRWRVNLGITIGAIKLCMKGQDKIMDYINQNEENSHAFNYLMLYRKR